MTAGLKFIFVLGVGGFSKRQHHRMTISDEMQQRLCYELKKSDAARGSISKDKAGRKMMG